MKKLVLLILLIINGSLMVGCNEADKGYLDTLGISKEIYNNIIQAIEDKGYEYRIEEPIIEIIQQYEDIYVFSLRKLISEKPNDLFGLGKISYNQIDGIILNVSGREHLKLVYKDKTVYTIEEAYEEEIIAREQIEKLFQYSFSHKYDEISMKSITPQTMYNISKLYYQMHNLTISEQLLTNYCIYSYMYGLIYDYPISDLIFVPILVDDINKLEYDLKIDEIIFEIPNSYILIVYWENEIYLLEEAYRRKILTKEDIEWLSFVNKKFKYPNALT